MRLLNRAAQRYLIQREDSTLEVGVPGPDLMQEADWLLQLSGEGFTISPSSDPDLALAPTESGVVCRASSSSQGRGRWEIHRADGDFKYLVDADSGLVLAVDIMNPPRVRMVLRRKGDRSAMWLAQEQCVDDARSVHLRYDTPGGLSLVYNEVEIERTPPGTFFCVAGFGANARAVAPSGYAGVQQRPDGSRIAIFSVWHRMADEVAAVPQAKAVIVGAAPQAETTQFSGEGSGSSIRIPYDWDDDGPIRFVLAAERLGLDTSIAAYVSQESAPWQHLGVMVRVETGGQLLGHPYSFIEDFIRNGNSPGVAATERSPFQVRAAIFRNPWVATQQPSLEPIRRAHVTAYSPHPLENLAAEALLSGNFGLRVATGTESASEPPPVGKRFHDPTPQRRRPPDLTSIPYT